MVYRKCLIYVMFCPKNILWNIMLARLLPFAMVNPAENPSDPYALTCIRWETSVKYLGNIHCSSMTNCDNIKYKKRIYISSVNKLNCQFSFASSSTRAKLLQTYCSAWYGSKYWQLDTESVRGIHNEWNKAISRTLGFPPCTRSKLLPPLDRNQSLTQQV